MLELLEETPWWVFILFLYLLIVGLRAAQPKTMPFKQLIVLPLLFFAWSAFTLSQSLEERYLYLIFWAASILFGAFLGYLQVRKWVLRPNRDRGTLTLPGSWSALILSMTIFGLKYFFAFTYATVPGSLQNPMIFTADVTLSGLIAGMFFGRFWRFKKCYGPL